MVGHCRLAFFRRVVYGKKQVNYHMVVSKTEQSSSHISLLKHESKERVS